MNYKGTGQKFTTIAQLQEYTTNLIKQAEENTINRLKETLLDYIDEDVYGTPETWYNRTGDLWQDDAWEIIHEYLTRRARGTEIRATLKAKDSMITHNAEEYQHVSPFNNSYELDAEELINLLNSGYTSLAGNEISARPFWNDFIKYTTKNYAKIFREECLKLGIPITGRSQGSYISENYGTIMTRFN